MADVVITAVLEKILAVANDELVLLLGVDKQLQKICSSFEAIKALLQDAETRQIQEASVRSWLLKLKGLSYEMEDLIEEWTLKSHQISSLILNKGCLVRSYAFPIYYFKHFGLRIKFGREIAEMKERLDQIGVEKEQFQFGKLKMKENIVGTPTHSYVDERIVMGREQDQEKLINKLFEGSSTDNIRVIAIVGMGGIGKTTLAQTMFNDERVKDYFEPRLWVCVSNDFDTKNIIIKIIEVGGGGHYSRETQIETVVQKLQVILANKRYLVVLDDVWNEEYNKWEALKDVLTCCGSNKSSRIVVTTRSTKVAEVVGSQYTHNLALLSDDDCWLIFKRIALEGRSEGEQYMRLEDVGRRIVKKCKRLPLAVKTVAGAVRCRRSRESWEEVLNSEIWALPQSQGDVIPALLLSFNELPLHLRQCFGYMSIFPKDYSCPVIEVIKMWVAQGYVTHSDGKDAEDVGEDYFRELVGRSFVHYEKFYEELRWRMHDLVHDVARFVMRGDQLHLFLQDPLQVEERHRGEPFMSWPTGLRTLLLDWDHCPGIGQYRSLRILQLRIVRMEDMDQIGNLIHLRSLRIAGEAIRSLPKSLKRLELLQYFVISEAQIRVLPEWICDLHDLRELSLIDCSWLEKLPEKIHLMTNLRYLGFKGTKEVMESFFFSKVGKLTGLRALPNNTFRLIRISEEGKLTSNIGQLSNLNNLRMNLMIENLDMVSTGEEASTAKLEDKRFIQSLSLCWDSEESSSDSNNGNKVTFVSKAESVIEALRPPPSIISELYILDYPGQKLCNWIENGDLLSSLLKLNLDNCTNCTRLPALGRLPCLTFLDISGFSGVIEVTGNDFSGGFPCLEDLSFGSMDNWKTWDTRTTTFPRLRKLNFSCCPKLQVVPPVFSTSLIDLTISMTPIYSLEGWAPPSIEEMYLAFLSTTNQLLSDLPSFPSLKILNLSNDEHLKEIPIRAFDKLPSLKSLILDNCSAMLSLPPGIALDYLVLNRMPTARLLRDSPCLPTVRHLKVMGDEELLELPGDVLVRFIALQELTLQFCHNLTTLPVEMSSLKELKVLRVLGCPRLEALCKRDGPLWSRISHIPTIQAQMGLRPRRISSASAY